MYRKNTENNLQILQSFLILDKEFPRSILACLINAEQSLITLSGTLLGLIIQHKKKLGVLKSKLEYTTLTILLILECTNTWTFNLN
jgi:uncharacterized alpha-E superfamily protein